jgi:hypothetical protein
MHTGVRHAEQILDGRQVAAGDGQLQHCARVFGVLPLQRRACVAPRRPRHGSTSSSAAPLNAHMWQE